MKKLLLLFIFTSAVSYSQMKVSSTETIGKVSDFGGFIASTEKTDDIVKFYYQDAEYTNQKNVKNFSFKASDIDTLYKLLTDFTGVTKGQTKTVELENGDRIKIEYAKQMGVMFAKVLHTDKNGIEGSVRYLTSNQLKKLFGKA